MTHYPLRNLTRATCEYDKGGVYMDELHFICSVYRELNLIMLNAICAPAS